MVDAQFGVTDLEGELAALIVLVVLTCGFIYCSILTESEDEEQHTTAQDCNYNQSADGHWSRNLGIGLFHKDTGG